MPGGRLAWPRRSFEALSCFTDEGKTACLHSPPHPRIPPWPLKTAKESLPNQNKQTATSSVLGIWGGTPPALRIHDPFTCTGTLPCCKFSYHHGIRGRRKWRRRREAQVFSPGKAKEETKTPLKTGGTETPIHERSHPLLPVLCPDIHRRYYQLCTVFLSTGSHGFGSW